MTQSFNTTTSMGRLTLNMLLSFAQFEREVTAERIRDKIAASKAKGMWMGGTPPLGYQPDGRSLAIIEEHAAIVRHAFARYLVLGNVRELEEELCGAGTRVPLRQRGNGSSTLGGGWFSRGQLYKILSNPVYTGRIAHRDQLYPGNHPAIVDPDSWAYAKAKLADNRQGSRTRIRAASTSHLAGKIVDAAGEPLVATHAAKPVLSNVEGGTARYRYYVSRALQHGGSPGTSGMRVPAREIETLVATQVASLLDDPLALINRPALDVPPDRLANLHHRCVEQAARCRGQHDAAAALVEQVRIEDGRVHIDCATAAIVGLLEVSPQADAPATLTLNAEARLTRSGRVVRMVHRGGSGTEAVPDRSLVKQLLVARAWWSELARGEIDIARLAAREKVTPSYMTRIVRLAFLAPQVVEAVLVGRQHSAVDARKLTLDGPLPACWKAQGAQMLPIA